MSNAADAHPQRLTCTTSVQTLTLIPDRSYTLSHERTDKFGASDINDIWCLTSGNSGYLTMLSGSDPYLIRVDVNKAIEVGPEFNILYYRAVGGAPVLQVAPSQKYRFNY